MKNRSLVAILLVPVAVTGCQDTHPTDLLDVSPSFAKATHTEVSGLLTLDGVGDCGQWGTVPSGHYQERDCWTHYTATGGFLADGWLVEKASFNFTTGNGTASGPMDLTVTEFLGRPVDGTMGGQITFNCKEWWCTTDFVLRGGGDLAGLMLRAHGEGWFNLPTSFAYAGTVVDPHGG